MSTATDGMCTAMMGVTTLRVAPTAPAVTAPHGAQVCVATHPTCADLRL
jgi:hypothetical protein